MTSSQAACIVRHSCPEVNLRKKQDGHCLVAATLSEWTRADWNVIDSIALAATNGRRKERLRPPHTSKPPRYCFVTNSFAGGKLVTFMAAESHSIRRRARTAMLLRSTISVSRDE